MRTPSRGGFRDAVVPPGATYDADMGEFVLPYDEVRSAADPAARLTDFLQATYVAAADLADWPRASLETPLGRPGIPRAIA